MVVVGCGYKKIYMKKKQRERRMHGLMSGSSLHRHC